MKGWQDELALLLMLRTVHPGETEANTALGGVFRAVNELTSSAKFRGIAQNLPIKFWSDCKHVQLGGFAKRNWAKCHQLSALPIQRAHAANRIAKEVNVFAGCERAGQDVLLHRRRR